MAENSPLFMTFEALRQAVRRITSGLKRGEWAKASSAGWRAGKRLRFWRSFRAGQRFRRSVGSLI